MNPLDERVSFDETLANIGANIGANLVKWWEGVTASSAEFVAHIRLQMFLHKKMFLQQMQCPCTVQR
jgi:hypothetical protein